MSTSRAVDCGPANGGEHDEAPLQATLEAVVKVHKAFEAISARLVDMQRGRAEEDEDVTGEEEEAIDKGGFRIAFGVVDGGGPVVGD